jgi:prevent-host-death family protein
MSNTRYKGVEEARNELPRLLEQAASGQATVITRHGRAVAALVPLLTYASASTQQSLLPYEGSGRGLWGKRSAYTIRKLRDEWNR